MSRSGSSLLLAALLIAAPIGVALAHQGPAGLEGTSAPQTVNGESNFDTYAYSFGASHTPGMWILGAPNSGSTHKPNSGSTYKKKGR